MASFHFAVKALIERNGKYLMVEEGKDHIHGKLDLPGGGVEKGENPVEAIEREIEEETGFNADVEELIAVLTGVAEGSDHPVECLVFRAETDDKNPEPVVDQEVLSAEFKKEEEIKDLDLRNSVVLEALEARENEGLGREGFSDYENF